MRLSDGNELSPGAKPFIPQFGGLGAQVPPITENAFFNANSTSTSSNVPSNDWTGSAPPLDTRNIGIDLMKSLEEPTIDVDIGKEINIHRFIEKDVLDDNEIDPFSAPLENGFFSTYTSPSISSLLDGIGRKYQSDNIFPSRFSNF
jgi:hypothetical protein